MKDINALSTICKCSFSRFIFLSILTLGTYPLMWLYRSQYQFRTEFGKAYWRMELPIIMAAVNGVAQILSAFVDGWSSNIGLTTFDILGGIIYLGLWIYWSFKMKEAIEEYVAEHFRFKVNINSFLLVLFGPTYIVYIINHLRKDYAIHQICSGG